ncbi:exopolyphosphatase [Lichenifustis flavocetrariae]|uniref:Exopolyphosphatase n=1 Tax=Lichenifustis flavocetrariae TaxID=2949735 RepID=A0AA41Z9W3_9HYPH|nr:exopolyphosphatase [Lichenifustis flavocetrariae]MCW6513163.1 exopolyphosphatase [Lichenifustis flavocetrariae]
MTSGPYRLVTRSDFDGLVCGMLLRESGLIAEIKFVHPKDMQDGLIAITDRDIITNLPYVPGCHLAFDHHSSEMDRNGEPQPNHIIDPTAPSAAHVVYRHFGGAACFPNIGEDLMNAVDKADSAQFSQDEILNPTGWTLLNFLMDSRTGLGRFRDFTVSNYELMMQLIDKCRHLSVDEVLSLPDVRERVALYEAHRERFADQLRRCTAVHGTLALLDLRSEETIFAGNRFMIYAMHPQCNISAHVMWGLRKQNTVFAIGKSILDRSSPVDVGAVCAAYGGGGHTAAGTCQVDNERAEEVKVALIERLNLAPLASAA